MVWIPGAKNMISLLFPGAVLGLPQFIRDPVGLIITLIGVGIGVVSLIWARRFRVNPRMVYQTHDTFVVGQPDATSYGDIRILFNLAPVPRVVVTQLGIWNAGNTTIRRDDIVATDPLMFLAEPGSSILGSTRLTATRNVNDFRLRLVSEDRSRAILEFDYLDAKDGAVFQIIHTGAMKKGKVTGSLRGIPRGVEYWGDLQEWSDRKSQFSEFIPLGIFLAILIPIFWFGSFLVKRHASLAVYFNEFDVVAILLFFAGIFASSIREISRILRAGSRATPKAVSRK
jgi:hypothetical protein